MATACSPFASTKETTNYARLCRLLVDVGSQVLKSIFDKIHPPATLHTVLGSTSVHYATLQSLYKTRKVLSPTQWGKLYPAHSTVSSATFDITLLTVLLRNICGLSSPANGWDRLPLATNISIADDIARVKYYRNTVYSHPAQASVDDNSFSAYWKEIREALVRLGGAHFRSKIDNLEHECMDPDIEEHYRELMKQWREDVDSIKDKVEKTEDWLEKMRHDIRDTTEGMEIEMKEVQNTCSSLTTTVEKSTYKDTTKRSFEKVISEVAEMDSELKVLEKKLCTLIAPVGEHNDEGHPGKVSFMATACSPFVSTKETTNYARLCRLLVDVGTEVLRSTFNKIHPPATLHTVLGSTSVHYATLQSLYIGKKKVLNPTLWGKLYPAHSPVSSVTFDITLLTVLLRNICGLSPPVNGWDRLPLATNISIADDIARVKYYRNTVYGQASQAFVDDISFSAYWQEIREALVRLGGAHFRSEIDNLEHDCMDPVIEEHYRELMKQWKKDGDSIKGSLEEIIGEMTKMDSKLKKVKEKLCTSTAQVGENRDEVPSEIRARGPEALEAYNNALAEGQTCVKRVPLMIVGQDRSGKTSVKKSLKGICFKPDENSTLGIEVDRYHFKVTTEIWKTGETVEEANNDTTVISFEYNTARWIAGKWKTHEKIAEVKKTSSADSAGYDFEEIENAKERGPCETLSSANLLESSINPASTNTTDDEPNLSSREIRNPTELEPEEDSHINMLEIFPDFDDVVKLLPQFLRENWEDDKEDIYSILWDFAGQSVYYVTHPLFLTRRAIYFLVYDLSRNPSDKATPLVKQGVYKEFNADKYNLKTNFDYLDFWMSSLAALGDPETVLPYKKFPAVFLVCTHADQPYCARDPVELAYEIFGDLRAKPYGAHLFDAFCVDNTKSGTESECKEIMRLRDNVHVVSKELPHVTEAIPIKWLKYEKALRALKESDYKFISLVRAKEIASKVCNINDNEIVTVLNFLHDLRVLIHFDDTPELSELVFLDIPWLIDVFKNVITVRAFREEKNFSHLWKRLEIEGILEEKLLKHVWNPLIPQRETHESLIAIMEKFSLLCPWPSSKDFSDKRYIVPSMLQTRPPKEISNLVESAKIPSLFIKFDTGRVPPGLFPRFVLEFFLWCGREFPRLALPQLYHNFARFNNFPNEGLSVVLLCHSSTIEVIVVSANGCIDKVNMASIQAFRIQLTSIINQVWNKFFWVKNVGCAVCFLCPVCSCGRMISLCTLHREEGCKEEECLHFISELDLGDETQAICTKSVAVDNQIQVEKFSPWISCAEEKGLSSSNVAARSHGEASEINPMKSATALKVTLLGSEWSSSMGGLSTINRQLAIQLAQHSEVEVTLLVPQSACSEDEKRMASSHNVSIREAKTLVGYSDPLDWLSFPPRDLVIDLVLGHGAKLGKQAQVIRDSHNCKWIQVVHTAPEELAMHKNYPKAISKGEEKNLTEVELCKLANAVVAVGPKLADAFSAQLRSSKSQDDILQLTPGTFHEFSDVKQAKKESNKFKVLTFGRGDPEDFSLKGYDISARAIVELKDRSYSLIFVGAPDGKQDEVAANLLESGIEKGQLTVRKFVQSKDRLKELFCEVDLCIMPSRTEGFGLTALEALSAGLPILVSGNSGFGEALCTLPSGKSFVVESEDPEEWAKAITGVRQKERSDRLQDIQQLRISYEEKFSWEKQRDILVEKMRDIVHAFKRRDTSFRTRQVEVVDTSTEQLTVDSLLTPSSLDRIIQMQLDASKVKSRIDLSLVLRNIASDRGFRMTDNEGLGNCMFHALSEQLETVWGIKIPHGKLRQNLVQYLRSNPKLPDGTDLFHFVHGHQTWTEYLVCMEQDGAWGDHVILSAAANYFGTCIRVISSKSNRNDVIIAPHFPVDESKPLVLGHIHEMHYVSLQPLQG